MSQLNPEFSFEGEESMQTQKMLQADGAPDVPRTQPADLPLEIIQPADNEDKNSLDQAEGYLAGVRHPVPSLAKTGTPPDFGDYQDPIAIGSLSASRLANVPSNAQKRCGRFAIMIENETGRDYYISGGTDWFEIHDGVVFTVQRSAKVTWGEGATNIGAGLWLICMGNGAGYHQ
jgi:hypothetical protein